MVGNGRLGTQTGLQASSLICGDDDGNRRLGCSSRTTRSAGARPEARRTVLSGLGSPGTRPFVAVSTVVIPAPRSVTKGSVRGFLSCAEPATSQHTRPHIRPHIHHSMMCTHALTVLDTLLSVLESEVTCGWRGDNNNKVWKAMACGWGGQQQQHVFERERQTNR